MIRPIIAVLGSILLLTTFPFSYHLRPRKMCEIMPHGWTIWATNTTATLFNLASVSLLCLCHQSGCSAGLHLTIVASMSRTTCLSGFLYQVNAPLKCISPTPHWLVSVPASL